MINRGKRSKTLSDVMPVENTSKNLQSFTGINPVQKEVLLSHKLQDHTHIVIESFWIKGDNPSQGNCQNQLNYPSLSHTEQKYQESFIQGKIHIQQNLNEDLKYS